MERMLCSNSSCHYEYLFHTASPYLNENFRVLESNLGIDKQLCIVFEYTYRVRQQLIKC